MILFTKYVCTSMVINSGFSILDLCGRLLLIHFGGIQFPFCLPFRSLFLGGLRAPRACEPGAMSRGGQYPCHLPLTLPLLPQPPSPPLPSLPPPPPPCLLVGALGSLHLGIWCAHQHIADFFLGNILWWWEGQFFKAEFEKGYGNPIIWSIYVF